MNITLFTDGGARGNPGPAGIGAVLYDQEKNVLAEISEYLGEATNNQAEYKALHAALLEAQKLGGKFLSCYLDSQLIVRQMQGIYKVKNPDLRIIFENIQQLLTQFERVEFFHVPRAQNKVADALVNKAIDAAGF